MSSRDEARLYDVRTLERNLRKGLINKKDLEKHIKALPDAADKATACNPEAQGREPAPPVYRPAVVAHPAPPVDDDSDLDEDGALLDDEGDEDEDEDEEADEDDEPAETE